MISNNKRSTRQLVPFRLTDFQTKPNLIKRITDDYLTFYWQELKDEDVCEIQERLLQYTG